MKKIFLSLIFMITLPVHAGFSSAYETKSVTSPLPINTLVREHSSIKESPNQEISGPRMFDYPTQIVRMEADVTDLKISCEEVFKEINLFFTRHISPDIFFYNTINYCSYDTETDLATSFMINSYFDPLNKEAIAYLEKYLAEHQGQNLLGKPFYVENAKSLVVSLNISAGIEDDARPYTLLQLRHDNHNHYFASNYDMRVALLKDVRQRFFSNQANLVLPFIGRWFQTSMGYYQLLLQKSNYVELRPELIFLMDRKPAIFNTMLKQYYGHHCDQYENKHCL